MIEAYIATNTILFITLITVGCQQVSELFNDTQDDEGTAFTIIAFALIGIVFILFALPIVAFVFISGE